MKPGPAGSKPHWPPALVLLFECLLFGLVYGMAARAALAYSSVGPNVTLIWPPTGISLFVFLRWGPKLAPGIVIGDLIANAGTAAPLGAILGIAIGNIAQTWLCWWALRRVGFDAQLQRVRDVMAILTLGTLAAAVSAFIGPASLVLGGTLPAENYPLAWLQWWMGDATGVVVLAPWLLAWWQRGAIGGASAGMTRSRKIEAALLLAVLVVLCELVFGGELSRLSRLSPEPGNYPAALALFPLVVWAALRFGLRGATLVTLLVTLAAVWGTVHGMGPFVDQGQTGSLARWWVFANVITVTGLLLAASQSERDRARAQAIRDRDFSTAVLDAEGAFVLVLDAQGCIVRVNRAFERATGFDSADIAGQRFEEALIPEEQRDKVKAHAELLRLRLSEIARHDSPLRRRSGPPITVSWTATALRGPDGAMTHSIVSGVDVSARVQAADALRHARRELEARVAERTRDLATANTSLQAEMVERQRLEQELIRISEHERQRLGRELHDGLGQHLTATAVQAELLARDLEAAGADAAQQSAQQIELMLSGAVAQTRLLARGLFPVEIGGAGLMGALQQLADTTGRQTRRHCTLRCPQPVDIADHAAAIHLYRIAQEAVTNAIRHAPGSDIEMALREEEGGGLAMEIRSSMTAPPRGNAAVRHETDSVDDAGIGLRIMRHRAHLIDADIAIGPQAAHPSVAPSGNIWVVAVRWAPGAKEQG